MTHHRRRSGLRALLVAGALGATALVAACSDADNREPAPATPTDSSITLSMPSATAQVPDPDEVGPAAGKQLCDMMSPEIDKWRAAGAAVARVSFNGTVHNWAVRNGGLNDTVLKDRSVIDKITTENCADVREQALEALDASDLAAALVGFGG